MERIEIRYNENNYIVTSGDVVVIEEEDGIKYGTFVYNSKLMIVAKWADTNKWYGWR